MSHLKYYSMVLLTCASLAYDFHGKGPDHCLRQVCHGGSAYHMPSHVKSLSQHNISGGSTIEGVGTTDKTLYRSLWYPVRSSDSVSTRSEDVTPRRPTSDALSTNGSLPHLININQQQLAQKRCNYAIRYPKIHASHKRKLL